MPNLYIVAGCNGAGKTTGSFAVLPGKLDCIEFVNADIIAYGLSPMNQESVALEAGRIMLKRMDELLEEKKDFAFETTLSSKGYVSLIKKAKARGYKITLMFFWLESPDMARNRVAIRVSKGGHNIPSEVVERRYYRGVKNLHQLYLPLCDDWIVINNTIRPVWIARKLNGSEKILDYKIWNMITEQIDMVKEEAAPYLSKAGNKFDRVMEGLREGYKKLVLEAAMKGESLVVFLNGKVQQVPAKDLLHTI